MTTLRAIKAALIAGAVIATASAAGAADPAPLTPRTAFFGNPVKAAGQLSPDGKWLSWMAPKDGVLNVWVAPAGKPGEARVMTDEKARPVATYFWSQDSSMILYATDNGGDENYQIYAADVATGARRALTGFEKARVGVIGLSHEHPDQMLIQANNRDKRFFDVMMLNLKTGAITPVFQNDAGYAGFLADSELNLRMALRLNQNG